MQMFEWLRMANSRSDVIRYLSLPYRRSGSILGKIADRIVLEVEIESDLTKFFFDERFDQFKFQLH